LHESHKDSKDNEEKSKLFSEYEELRQQLQGQSGLRWQELAVAFFGGCLSFVALASSVRYVAGRIRCNTVQPVNVQTVEGVAQHSYAGSSNSYTRLEGVEESLE
jgi:hypothetical protein